MLDFDRRYVLVPAIIVVACLIGGYVANEMSRNTLIDTVQDIQLSQERARLLVDIQQLVTDAESSQRGFVLTGDDTFLEPYERTKREISGYLTEVQRAYGAPAQAEMHAMATKLIELSAAKLNELDSTIALSREGQRQALSLVRTKIGEETMRALRGLVADMRNRERNTMVTLTNSWFEVHQAQRRWVTIGTILNIALIILTAFLVAREIRRKTFVATDLEHQVKQKTKDLSDLSTHLQKLSESEKFALARELHDELGGLLIAIKMDLAQMKPRIDLSQADMAKRWERMQSALSAGIDLKRRIIEQLRPSLLDNMGLIAAIRWQAGELSAAAGLKLVEQYPEIEPAITSDAAIAIYRIVQEALNNVVKHAKATQVTIRLELTQFDLKLQIEDDGVGLLDPGAIDVSHGINSMRHRLLPFGGSFAVRQAAPRGTRIEVSVPLNAIEKQEEEAAA